MKKAFIVVAVFAIALLTASVAMAGIAGSKHNLASSSTNTIKSTNTDELCVFCHTPHAAQSTAPLWNRTLDYSGYTMYGTTVAANTTNLTQPNPSTAICMSCHDGVTTLGGTAVLNAPGSGAGTSITMTQDTITDTYTNISKDLTNDHPVSIEYDPTAAGLGALSASGTMIVRVNSTTGAVEGLANATVECVSCHDPHDNTNGLFLRYSNPGSQLCRACHSGK